jgi:SAM-dependent methyltransferase
MKPTATTAANIDACLICKHEVQNLLDLGPQPPSNRFPEPDQNDNDQHPLLFGQCGHCGLFQLKRPMLLPMLRPRVNWVGYREPEDHLDDLADRLARLPGLSASAQVGGVTHNDDSLARRLTERGHAGATRVAALQNSHLERPAIGLETEKAVYAALTDPATHSLCGSQDMLLVRHVIEHTHDPVGFARTLMSIVRPGGYLVFEVPGCSRFIGAGDHSFLWEEHVSYFSPSTLRACLQEAGLEVTHTLNYPFALEDSLVCIARRPSEPISEEPPANTTYDDPPLGERLHQGVVFARRFVERREVLHTKFRQLELAGKRVGLFGASHLGSKFVNFFGLAQWLTCAIDDNPNKIGKTLSGSRLPIVASSVLRRLEVDVCLSSLNPESERKVLPKLTDFIAAGGQFRSIFQMSERAF